jgi:hypothetical protein
MGAPPDPVVLLIRSSLILLLFPAAAPAWGAPPRPPAAKPAPPAFRSLSAAPASISLEGPGARQGLLATGVPVEGPPKDLSRTAAYRTGNPKVASVSPDGTVQAVGDGSAWIEVRAAGKTARVPVRVRGARRERPVSFTRDVMPLLGKAGCSGAACHAKQGGKNGFQLSVLAFDPEADHAALARQAHGRRINRMEPGASLFLLKATGALPHGGGKRIEPGSPEYRLLARWVAEGARFGSDGEPALTRVEVEPAERVMAPKEQQQLLVTAVYADGSRRDVTRLAQFRSDEAGIADVDEAGRVRTSDLAGEAAVMARFMGQVAVARFTVPLNRSVPAGAYAGLPRLNFIDDLVYRKLSRLNVLPSDLCDDATFLRRVYLDLIAGPLGR